MGSLLNTNRPPVFCPGCGHERIVHALDQTLTTMGLTGQDVVIVSDIGCSGLFDTFFHVHALHGLHGRALTYATGIKMARPQLTVIVTMGDGGLGIGGAHLLSTCRRNIDLTLLVLNNFNYGMTGGQFSATTPQESQVASSFLNRLEKPVDISQVAAAAGAASVTRASAYDAKLPEVIQSAIQFDGFSLVDIQGICTGRYTQRNKLTPKSIAAQLKTRPSLDPFLAANVRPEFSRTYREESSRLTAASAPQPIETRFKAPTLGRQEIVILGSAGQRILTAGELLCLAGAFAGLHATQKNDYPITVMRGHSISEVILSSDSIGFTGIQTPTTIIALAAEGVLKRQVLFDHLSPDCQVIAAKGIDLPQSAAEIVRIDFKAGKFKSQDWALAAITFMARSNRSISVDMLKAAMARRFKGTTLSHVMAVVESMLSN